MTKHTVTFRMDFEKTKALGRYRLAGGSGSQSNV